MNDQLTRIRHLDSRLYEVTRKDNSQNNRKFLKFETL